MSSNPCNYMDCGGGDHLTADQGCAWLFMEGQSVGAGLGYGL